MSDVAAIERTTMGRKPSKTYQLPPMLERRIVDNPMLTEGLATYHEQTRGSAERRVEVLGNAMTRIGALCFIRRARAHHKEAAADFKRLYEAELGRGAPAMDPEKPFVDSSPRSHDDGIVQKLDRASEINQLITDLGKERFDRLVALLVLCIPAGEGQYWRDRKASIDTLLTDLDLLAVLRGYATAA